MSVIGGAVLVLDDNQVARREVSGNDVGGQASDSARMRIEVRTFNASDHAAAFRLWEHSEGVGLSEADSPEGIASFLNRNPGLSFLALDGNQLVGTILCGHDGRRGFIH